jgi:isocitrate dehydrogenase
VGQLDNRDSHYFFALYWAQALASQEQDATLAEHFAPIAEALLANQDKILSELANVQGQAVDIGGYYRPDRAKLASVMRPSQTLNDIIAG